MKQRTIALLSLLVTAAPAASQERQGTEHSGPPALLRPYLAAISVADLDPSIAWYRDNLGFSVVERGEAAAQGLRIAILSAHEFKLELVEKRGSIPPRQCVDTTNPAQLRGLGKLAFLVDDVRSLAASLKQRGAVFAMEVREDAVRGSRTFIVEDPDGNWIQFTQDRTHLMTRDAGTTRQRPPGGLLAASTLPALLAVSMSATPLGGDGGQSAGPADAPAVYAPGVVSTNRAESAPAFSPDGREFYFSRADGRGWRQIFVSRFDGNAWGPARPVSFSDGSFDDSKATLAADGQLLVFASNRPLPGVAPAAPTFLNLWVSRRHGDSWSEPEPIGPEVNTPSDEDFPFLAADGTLWFASNRSGKATDYRIYRSRLERGRFQQAGPANLPFESGLGEAVCYVAPDRRYLLFMSMRSGGAGAIDLYVSFRQKDGSWGEGMSLGSAVNSPALDWFATLTPDGRHLLFSSTRSGAGDIYLVDAAVIEAAKAVKPRVADISGSWAGTVALKTSDGKANTMAIRATLAQEGILVTGSVGPSPDAQFAISHGRRDGDSLAFAAGMPTRVYAFQLSVLSADRMEGRVASEDGKAFGTTTMVRQPGRQP